MIKFLFGIVLFVSGFYRTIFVDPVWGLYLFAALTHIRIGQLAEEISLPMNIHINQFYTYKWRNNPAYPIDK